MFKTIANAFKVKEVRRKLLITLLLLFIYRVGCWIPLPGIELDVFRTTTEGNDFLGLISAVSGGALANGAILALGVAPYITSSIIMQLMTFAIPSLQKLSKEGGDEGRKRINFYTRIIALVLSLAQAIGIMFGFAGYLLPDVLWEGAPAWLMGVCLVLLLTAGGMFTVWLGERITDLNIGNGMSLLIFVGILSSASSAMLSSIMHVGAEIDYLWNILIFLAALVLIFTLIVIVDLAERRVPVQYAKQIKGRKMYGGQSTYSCSCERLRCVANNLCNCNGYISSNAFKHLLARIKLVFGHTWNGFMGIYFLNSTFNFILCILYRSNDLQSGRYFQANSAKWRFHSRHKSRKTNHRIFVQNIS